LPFSRLGVILAHNLVEPGIVDGRKDVRKNPYERETAMFA
jgi:hypothetical protein